MSADPAIVNVPLAKRGDINAQLDAYKREKLARCRAEAKAASQKRDSYRKECFAIIDAMPAERFALLGANTGQTAKQAEASLRSKAYWQPAVYLPILQREATIQPLSGGEGE